MSLLLAVLSGLCFERANPHLVNLWINSAEHANQFQLLNESALDLNEQKSKRLTQGPMENTQG